MSEKSTNSKVSCLPAYSNKQLCWMVSAFNHCADALMVVSKDATILHVNYAFSSITGFAASEVVGQKISLLKSGKMSEAFYQHFWHCLLSEGQWQGEILNKRKDGSIYPQWLSVRAVSDVSGICYFVASFSDITLQKRAEQRLNEMVYVDELTGLNNRSLLVSKLTTAMQMASSNSKLALAFIDLDGFKLINDNYGHDAGDYYLQASAHKMKSLVRNHDVLARLGGDEFVLLITQIENQESVEKVIQRLLADIAIPVSYRGQLLGATVSVGLVFYPQDNQDNSIDAQRLLKQADVAMYRAKENGKNTYYVLN